MKFLRHLFPTTLEDGKVRIDRSTRRRCKRMRVRRGANSQRIRNEAYDSFFCREIEGERREDVRSFDDPSPPRLLLPLAHIALERDAIGIRIRVLCRNSGRVCLDRFSTSSSSSISRNWSNRRSRRSHSLGEYQPRPTHSPISFFLGKKELMEFKKFPSTCYSPRFLDFRFSLSLSLFFGSNKRRKQLIPFALFKYLLANQFLLLQFREILARERLIFEETMLLIFDKKEKFAYFSKRILFSFVTSKLSIL